MLGKCPRAQTLEIRHRQRGEDHVAGAAINETRGSGILKVEGKERPIVVSYR